jgi:hypothetical protein
MDTGLPTKLDFTKGSNVEVHPVFSSRGGVDLLASGGVTRRGDVDETNVLITSKYGLKGVRYLWLARTLRTAVS